MPTLESPILPLDIPSPYTARPVSLSDVAAAADLENAHNIALVGKPSIEADEIRSDWEQPTMNLATNTLGIFAPDGTPAALAEVWDHEPHVRNFVYAVVHPQHQGRGLGTVLAGWAEARGRQLLPMAPASARVILRQFKMSSDEAAARLLRRCGYALVRHNFRMTIDFDEPPSPPTLPGGLIIRPFIHGQEDRALLAANREAFQDHWGHVERPFEQEFQEWQHWMETAPTFDPSLVFVAMADDEIVGTALSQARWAEDPEMGWISGLGVRRPWRRRGVGLALLRHCFCALYDRGKRRAGLGVDAESLTGATRLYEKAGMHVERQYAFFERELRGGTDLTLQALT